MESTNQFDPSNLQSLLGDSAPSLIPESLVTTLTVGFIVLNVLGILFFVFYVANMIRKWRVDTAILHMQKDVAEIKARLDIKPVSPEPAPPVEPTQQNRTIAQEDTPSRTDSVS